MTSTVMQPPPNIALSPCAPPPPPPPPPPPCLNGQRCGCAACAVAAAAADLRTGSGSSQPAATESPPPGPGDEAGGAEDVEGAPPPTPVPRNVVIGPAAAFDDNPLSSKRALSPYVPPCRRRSRLAACGGVAAALYSNFTIRGWRAGCSHASSVLRLIIFE